ncbi:hypothetical protein SLEP1_g10653 [Rubroshorea leprosula]|uniref:Phorbol-ester/DAG-type domain-containing protein n=1 Tax=Rubroshorea leprosula TaxID=152421 RepID=A0AAV5ID91_9ROSI|nr:hypothetical protein SLEP1_g10653 [Rubroshorea leprosula]
MEINHFSHHHRLVLLDQETGIDQSPKHYCSGCEEAVEGFTYGCGKCRFFLHKRCAELPGEINHPLHHEHPLVLSVTPYVPFRGFICDLCQRSTKGFAYHCSSCKFDLDIRCATHPELVAGDFQKLHHFSHDYPLIFVQHIDSEEKNKICPGCERGISSPFYCCPDCIFYLHKRCAELPLEITHHTHQKHPLFLLAKSPLHEDMYYKGFVYYCSICEFGIPIRYTFVHEHQLVVVEETSTDESAKASCSRCKEPVQDSSSSSCGKCRFFIHEKCAELPLEVSHPFHLQHPLILHDNKWRKCNMRMPEKSSSGSGEKYDRWKMGREEQSGDQETGTDQSPKHYCSGCEEAVEGSTYSCRKCRFFLHKKCAELPGEINHPLHRQHPLVLSTPTYEHVGSIVCNLCHRETKGFVYQCSSCKFHLDLRCATHPQLVTGDFQKLQHFSHDHPLIFVQHIDFGDKDQVCSGCKRSMSNPFYCCPDCMYHLHKKCAELSLVITHHTHQKHPLFLLAKPPLQEDVYHEGFVYYCSICEFGIPIRYTYVHEHPFECNYFAHVNCAIDEDLLEEEEEEESKLSTSDDSTGDVSCAFTEIKPGEIEHFAHEHNLIFNDRGFKDGQSCDGCMRPIATSFYYCEDCDFFIHEGCAKLLKKVRHWARKHSMELFFYIIFECDYCGFWNSGFGYKCDEFNMTMCIRCYEILDTCTVERHEHPLFFDHKYKGSCCGCGSKLMGGFRCKDKKCKFAIDYRCLVLPDTARYKYHNHPLMLTFRDDHHRSQCYCDICEEDRDPRHWFYHCANCDVSAHPSCLLRNSPYVRLGKPGRYAGHHPQHLVTFVKIDFNPPKCNKCDKPCRDGLAIQCTESDCNYIRHWDWYCLFREYSTYRSLKS